MGNDCSLKPRSQITQSRIHEFTIDEESNFEMGKTLEGRFEYQEASYYYLQVIKQNPNSAMAYYGLANCLLKTEDARAQLYYQLAIDCDPNCKFAYNGLGILYDKAHNHHQAETNFKKAIEIDPEFAFPYNGIGNMYYHQKKYELAIDHYETAQRLMPNNPVVLANIACCQMDMGKTEEALVTFKKAKDALNIEKNMNPSNKIYLNNKMKDFSQAMENKDPKFQKQFEEIKNNDQNLKKRSIL